MSVTSGRTFSLLPMLGHTKGKRSPVTCALKCDNACSGEVCNTSTNSYFRDIASATMSRRAALGFGAAGALAVVLGNAVTSAGTAVADGGPGLAAAAKDGFGASKLKFSAIAPVDAAVDKLTVPAGFTWQPVIRWGDPLFNDSPAFDVDHQSAEAQARQFGYNNDFRRLLPAAARLRQLRARPALTSTTSTPISSLMFRGLEVAEDPDAGSRPGSSCHGCTAAPTIETPPQAGSRLDGVLGQPLCPPDQRSRPKSRSSARPPATTGLKNQRRSQRHQGAGHAEQLRRRQPPWARAQPPRRTSTGISAAPPASPPRRPYKRYGSRRPNDPWPRCVERFDVAKTERAQPFRLDRRERPYDPATTPDQAHSLGRFKHEGANSSLTGTAARACIGDDERFDYLYKFVSKASTTQMTKAHNMAC